MISKRMQMLIGLLVLSLGIMAGLSSTAGKPPVGGPAVDDSVEDPADANPAWDLLLELPDDPPGQPPPATSRSPAQIWTRGNFASVQVNVDPLGNNILGDAANEPSIAVDATDHNNMAIGWRQFDTVNSNFRQAGWGYTQDAGQSWTFPGVIQPGVFRSDPVLSADSNGNLFYLSLKVVGSSFTCDLLASTDGGQTWNLPAFAFGGDKAWLAIDRTGSAHDGQMYQAWNVAGNNFFPNQFNRSLDGGMTWSNPVQIPNRPVFGTVAVGPDGAVYVAGVPNSAFTSQFFVAKSSSAQDPLQSALFEQVVQVNMAGALVLAAGPNPAGLLGQVWIAADHSGGANHGNLYLLSSVQPGPFGSDPMDIHFTRSTDGGLTWSIPVRVNDDAPNNGAWQWFGTMSVAPNGRIDVIWNDTRSTLTVNLSELFYSNSTDGGLTWSPNVPLSPIFNSHIGWPNQNKLGDYYDMVSDNAGADLAYAATFNGEQDVYYLRISLDCNSNGIPDECDLDCGPNGGACDLAGCGQSEDCDNNGVPNQCDTNLALAIELPNDAPAVILPATPTTFAVEITELCQALVPDSPMLHYRYDGGGFQNLPLASMGGTLYDATLPAPTCMDQPQFYISARGDDGDTVTLPANAPLSFFSAQVGPQSPLALAVPNGVPRSILPLTPTSLLVSIDPRCEALLPGSPLLHFRYDGGSFQTAPLVAAGGTLHQAMFPAAGCTDRPEFYVSAQGDGGSTVTLPAAAPASLFSMLVGELTLAVDENFDAGTAVFSYQDGLFRGTQNPDPAVQGTIETLAGGSGAGLRVALGPNGTEMSGGWIANFEVIKGPADVQIEFYYRLVMSGRYEPDEFSEALLSVDGVLLGVSPNDYLARFVGDGNLPDIVMDTGWRQQSFLLIDLSSGSHQLVVGGYNNASTEDSEFTDVFFDDLSVAVRKCELAVEIDVKPGSCPNSFNRHSHGVLPMALLGTSLIDVTQIDPTSVTLSRADGVGGSVGPHQGPPGPGSLLEDAGTPFEGESCQCHEASADGVLDLSMKFLSDAVVEALELGGLTSGDLIELTLKGTLLDGTPFSGSDCVRLVPPGMPPGRLSVDAGAGQRWIEVAPLDLQLDGGGLGLFERTYPLTSVVTLTAPQTAAGQWSFGHWILDGVPQPASVRTVNMGIFDQVHEARAVYVNSGPADGSPRKEGLSDEL